MHLVTALSCLMFACSPLSLRSPNSNKDGSRWTGAKHVKRSFWNQREGGSWGNPGKRDVPLLQTPPSGQPWPPASSWEALAGGPSTFAFTHRIPFRLSLALRLPLKMPDHEDEFCAPSRIRRSDTIHVTGIPHDEPTGYGYARTMRSCNGPPRHRNRKDKNAVSPCPPSPLTSPSLGAISGSIEVNSSSHEMTLPGCQRLGHGMAVHSQDLPV
jgi:hypothetical protein